MSANFIKIFEIQSDVPIVSDATPPKNKRPLALTLKVYGAHISVYSGIPAKLIRKIPKVGGEHNYEKLHSLLVGIKDKNQRERDLIIEPIDNVNYEILVKVMDAARSLRRTDKAYFKTIKDKEGNSYQERHYELFDKIVFGNIQG